MRVLGGKSEARKLTEVPLAQTETKAIWGSLILASYYVFLSGDSEDFQVTSTRIGSIQSHQSSPSRVNQVLLCSWFGFVWHLVLVEGRWGQHLTTKPPIQVCEQMLPPDLSRTRHHESRCPSKSGLSPQLKGGPRSGVYELGLCV